MGKGKRTSLMEHIDTENPHMFLLTETLLPTNCNVAIPGYSFFGRNRQDKKGGGVGVLVRNDVKNMVIPHTSERPVEMIWLSIRRTNNSPLFIGCYYGKQESRCKKEEIR